MLSTRIVKKHQANGRLVSLLGSVALALICAAPAHATTLISLNAGSLGSTSIPLTSYSQNASSSTNPTNKVNGAQAGAAVCGQVTITKLIDQTSPAFLKVVLGSFAIPEMVITFSENTAPPITYSTITLQNVLATSITQSDNTTDVIAEQIVLSAGRFRFSFNGQNPDGSFRPPVTFGFDCTLQSPLP